MRRLREALRISGLARSAGGHRVDDAFDALDGLLPDPAPLELAACLDKLGCNLSIRLDRPPIFFICPSDPEGHSDRSLCRS